MKKLSLLVAFTAIALGASAQEFSYGIKAGLSISNIGGKEMTSNENKVGYFFGISTEIELTRFLSIAPELSHSAQGVKIAGGGIQSIYRLNYINLPVMAKYYILENWSVNIGPQFGYAVTMRINKDDGEFVNLPSEEYNSFDLALAAGTTYKYGNVYLDARYNYGLTEVLKSVKCYNRVFQLGVGRNF